MFKKPIRIKFIWTQELAVKASKLYYDYDMKNSSKRYIGWFFIALTQFGIVGALKHNSFGLLYLSTFLVLYWYYIRWYVRKAMIIRFYKNSNLHSSEVTFVLKDDGLHHNDTVIDFDNITKVIKFDDGVLLQTNANTLFFEKDAFESTKDMSKLLAIMKERGKI